MTTLLFRLFAGGLFRNAAGDVIKGWEWIFSTPVHILETLALAAVLFGAWERHEATVARREVPAWQGAYGDMKGAYVLERGQVQSLVKAIGDQNRAIDTFAATQANRENAAKAALRQAAGRAERLEAVASRIDAERAQGKSGGQDCRTGKAVMAAKNDL